MIHSYLHGEHIKLTAPVIPHSVKQREIFHDLQLTALCVCLCQPAVIFNFP